LGEEIRLESRFDGSALSAYRADAQDARRGGLVLIQEIFGVTRHIRALADGYAADGYETLAPSLFDRLEDRFEVGYDAASVEKARRFSEATPWDQVASDLEAAIVALAPPVFVVGYCWGGTAAWLAACRCPCVTAVSSFYGRRIPELLAEVPRCPIILHFGRRDASIPTEVVEAIGAACPDVPLHLYDAGHGFVSDRGPDYQPDAARLARLRTLQLFALNGGGRGEI